MTRAAVAVSGGPDSLQLLAYAKQHYTHVHALIVDHRLRPDSTEEARKVASWLDTPVTILTWEHPTIETGKQEKAREARYQLMVDWCKAHDYPVLLVGHHRQDQLETFLMRLSRGSGPRGLCGMQPELVREGIQILRPFLALDKPMPPEQYVDDPSNQDETYTRVRYRKAIGHLVEAGFSMEGFQTSLRKLQAAEDFLQQEEDRFFAHHVQGLSVTYEALRQLPLVLFERVAQRWVGQSIRYATVERLWQALQSPAWKASTMGGYVWRRKGELVTIYPEMRRAESKNYIQSTRSPTDF